MSTEGVDPRFIGIDQWPMDVAVESMLEAQLSAVAAVRSQIEQIAHAATAVSEKLNLGGRLVYVGAGTSGRIAVQDGVELTPTFNFAAGRIIFMIAGGMDALSSGIEGAEDNAASAQREMEQHSIDDNDVVIGVAASGRTPYTVAALEAAKSRGALTIAIANNRNADLFAHAAHALLADTGSEVVAGSTRMKAGTAQKVMLNILSTAAMMRCGYVYDGLMVNMRPTNKKLVSRAQSIVSRISNVSDTVAVNALEQAGNDIRLAVLIAQGVGSSEAAKALAQANGSLRRALGFVAQAKVRD